MSNIVRSRSKHCEIEAINHFIEQFFDWPHEFVKRGYFNITLKYTFKLMSFLTLHCIKIVKNLSNMSFRNSVLCFFVAFC